MYRINFGNLQGQELKDGWGLLPDPMGRCRRQSWWKSVRKEGLFFPSYDDDAFWPTTVPAAYNRIHPQLEYYEGDLVYLNRFPARLPQPGERVFLHFGAVADRCSVFLNGLFIGEHDGGYTAFTMEVTRELLAENRLLMLVNCSRQADDVPGVIHDWFHDGGIHRPVRLFYRPAVYVRDLAVSIALNGDQVQISIRVLVDGSSRDCRHPVTVRFTDPETGRDLLTSQVQAVAGSWESTTTVLPRAQVRLWQPAAPFQYRVTATLGNDSWTDEVGLREVRTRGRDLLLNGEPIILRGVGVWMEDPQRGIFSLGPEATVKTMAILRDLNCNFARAGHRPQSREFVRACDQVGILVWMEVPAYWLPDMQKPARSRRALKALDEMLCEHRNAASVILWSIGNECAWHDKNAEQSNVPYFVEAADFCHEQDPSRLVTYTGGIEGVGTEKFAEANPPALLEKLDVIGVNSYSGINDGAEPGKREEFPDQETKLRAASVLGKPVILAEAGIDAVLGEKGFDFGEERQAGYHAKLQELFHKLSAAGVLQGMCLFVLNDFKTPIKLGRFQKGYNRKGLITEKLEPKPAYAIVRDGYRQ